MIPSVHRRGFQAGVFSYRRIVLPLSCQEQIKPLFIWAPPKTPRVSIQMWLIAKLSQRTPLEEWKSKTENERTPIEADPQSVFHGA